MRTIVFTSIDLWELLTIHFKLLFCVEVEKIYTQCADEKSNESVEDMGGTFTGW